MFYYESMLSHYEVLGVKFNCSLIDIKLAYRRRILEAHPDKGGGLQRPLSVSVNDIQEAYKVLNSSELRSKYDEQIIESEKNSGYVVIGDGLDTYSLDDFEFDPGTLYYSMDCPRCEARKGYNLSEDNMEKHAQECVNGGFEVLSQCSGCSLWLKVAFDFAPEDD